jgi:glycosyltransferase involved in cell wall biosynthesis
MCWNGNVVFFDHVADLKRRYPSLRIINQLFNHDGGWIEHYCRSVVDNIDCHVAVNTQVESALIEDRSVPPDKVVRIFHGIEIPERQAREDAERSRRQIRERLGIPPDVVLVGTFIRLHPQKRPLDVLRVARKLSTTGIHFLLVGGGPMADSIEAELGRRPLDNVTRLPLLPDPTDLYDAIDICFMTSSFEGLPVFLLDGLARGIPCVATAVGDIPLLLEAGGGFTCDEPGDIDGLAENIRRLAEDEEFRRAQGALGRARVASDFNLEKFVSAYEAVIFPSR